MTATYFRQRPMQAFLLAIAAEAGLLAIGAVVLSSTRSAPALSTPVPISLVQEEVPAPPETPVPPKPTPVPVQPKPKLAPTKPHAPSPPRTTPPVPQTQQATPMPTDAPNAFTEPVSPPAPPPPPVAATKADPSPEYAAKVRSAVLAAVYYPPAAAVLHFTGRVRVEFHLRDAIPADARVLSGSGLGMIDRAALQAVQNAHYPEPPAEMRGSDRVYQVWVEFKR